MSLPYNRGSEQKGSEYIQRLRFDFMISQRRHHVEVQIDFTILSVTVTLQPSSLKAIHLDS